ncbi:MAG: hypothetical protein LIP77_07980, partial [Planctomycetes bacterium]|nr:hypothetical protein [Planctomycetota bacterium]
MPSTRSYATDGTLLYRADGKVCDPGAITFAGDCRALDPAWRRLTAREAVAWLQSGKNRIRPPVAVIGPREASAKERATAFDLGQELAGVGLTVLCGGRQGVMEEVC